MIVETERLILRKVTLADKVFLYTIMNDPSWIRFIGDRNIKTHEDAAHYIEEKYIKVYEQFGFGLYLVALKSTGTAMGLCGLVKRDTLEDVDIGFAFLPQYTGQGYAYESALAVMDYAKNTLKIPRVVAITDPDNIRSGKLLEKIGLRFDKTIRFSEDGEESKLYVPVE